MSQQVPSTHTQSISTQEISASVDDRLTIPLSKTELELYSNHIQISSISLCSNKYKKCIIIQRLLICLKYYSNLINTKNYKTFYNFMDKIYKKQIYDDYYHFTKCHEKELKLIKSFAIKSYKLDKCKLSKCKYSDRHYRVDQDQNNRNRSNNDETMKYNDIYIETMDSLHYYLFHLTITGMRQNIDTENDQYDDEKESNPSSSEHFDLSFKRRCDDINKNRNKTKRFKRISGNKFNISVVESEVNDDDTFLDAIYRQISRSQKNDKDKLVFQVKDIIETNGYDTDSLDIDIEMFINDKPSNLEQLLKDKKGIHKRIVHLLQKYKSYLFLFILQNQCFI